MWANSTAAHVKAYCFQNLKIGYTVIFSHYSNMKGIHSQEDTFVKYLTTVNSSWILNCISSAQQVVLKLHILQCELIFMMMLKSKNLNSSTFLHHSDQGTRDTNFTY
jgi:hypothetical protein